MCGRHEGRSSKTATMPKAPEEYALLVLENLQFAVLLFGPTLEHVRLSNVAGRDVLKQFRATAQKPPRELVEIIQSNSSTAQRCVASSGASYYVRVRSLPAGQGVLVVVTEAVLRDADLIQRLSSRFGLTQRDCRIVALVSAGNSNQEIAREMKLQLNTVKHYLSAIFETVGVKSRTQLLALLQRLSVS
jgi:DNA-binding NarL/FixJ family response regulator